MTDTMTNEAAERLREWLEKSAQDPVISPSFFKAFAPHAVSTLDEALAAERRATVERIVQRWHDAEQWRDGGSHPDSSIWKCGICSAILDEEAAR